MILMLVLDAPRDSGAQILSDMDHRGRFLLAAGFFGAAGLMLVTAAGILIGELRLAHRDWLVRHWPSLAGVACFVVAALCLSILSHLPNTWADGFHP